MGYVFSFRSLILETGSELIFILCNKVNVVWDQLAAEIFQVLLLFISHKN